ncbi:MAG: hypothetical protein QHG98_08075 [Methanothrix sp.]|jgi:hypothetical protein|nr:hypothetical protein [Methanothrix sp.]
MPEVGASPGRSAGREAYERFCKRDFHNHDGPVRITLLPPCDVIVEHKHFTEVVPAFYGSCPSQASRFLILAFEVHGYGAELFA